MCNTTQKQQSIIPSFWAGVLLGPCSLTLPQCLWQEISISAQAVASPPPSPFPLGKPEHPRKWSASRDGDDGNALLAAPIVVFWHFGATVCHGGPRYAHFTLAVPTHTFNLSQASQAVPVSKISVRCKFFQIGWKNCIHLTFSEKFLVFLVSLVVFLGVKFGFSKILPV